MDGIQRGLSRAEGDDGGLLTMAHSLYGIGYSFYRERLSSKTCRCPGMPVRPVSRECRSRPNRCIPGASPDSGPNQPLRLDCRSPMLLTNFFLLLQ